MAEKLWVGADGNYGTAGNWSPSGVPSTGDNVRIPAGGGSISTSLDQSAVAIGDFIVEEGYTGTIGTSAAFLEIDPNAFSFSGQGTAYIDVGAAAIPLDVRNTANATTGNYGLYLIGSAITVLSVTRGRVGLAIRSGETSTVTTAVRTTGGQATIGIGSGVTLTGTSIDILAGTVTSEATIIDADVSGGTLTLLLAAAATKVNVNGGAFVHNSTGTVIDVNMHGGSADWTQSGVPRTITNLTIYKGFSTMRMNPQAVTITNDVVVADSVIISVT
jgi:hypothetical protein